MMDERHRILLVNFTPQEATLLAKAGFNVELGYLGRLERSADGKKFLPYCFPRPLFEYEVYVYNSAIPYTEIAKVFPSTKNLAEDEKTLEVLTELGNSWALRIAFIGSPSGLDTLLLGGVGSIRLIEAHEGVSDLQVVSGGRTFAIAKLEEMIANLRGQVRQPVGQYLTWGKKESYPIYHLPVILNRRGDEVAAYGVIYRDRCIPLYVVLPQLQDNVVALRDLLKALTELRPELFPDIKILDWYDSDEFALSEEKAIAKEIGQKIEEAKSFIEAKQREKVAVAERFHFLKDILIATEAGDIEPNRRLSASVRAVLEFLGFEVTDIDAQIKGVIRKEDFWVRDGDFLAITEVTGTVNKNPRITEYNGLLGRMTTIFKRHDLVPDASAITGLLIVNHDLNTHPFRRPKLYSGDQEEIVEAAKEHKIGLLSTVELYKMALAVKEGHISRDEARALIRQFGRIEFRREEK